MEDLFGPIIDADAVEQAAAETLRQWARTYLAKMEVAKGYARGSITPPLAVLASSDFGAYDGTQLPYWLVLSSGTVGKPEHRGDSTYAATWALGVAPVVSDVDEFQTRRLASAHAGAVRGALAQHKMLKSDLHPTGFAKSCRWQGETYTDLPFLATRNLGSMRVIFYVTVDNVVKEYAGPRTPIPNPTTEPIPPDFGQIKEVNVTGHLDKLTGAPS